MQFEDWGKHFDNFSYLLISLSLMALIIQFHDALLYLRMRRTTQTAAQKEVHKESHAPLSMVEQ